MSALRARCPDCRTLTAVAIGPEYQCHSCGREFAAGLVRIGSELALPWPEAAVVEDAQDLAGTLPARPLVLAASAAARARVEAALGAELVWVDAGDPGLADPAALERAFAALPTPAGAGFSGFPATPESETTVTRLAHALGL